MRELWYQTFRLFVNCFVLLFFPPRCQGLITEERKNIDQDASPFARKVKEINRQGLREGASLVEVVCKFPNFSYRLITTIFLP